MSFVARLGAFFLLGLIFAIDCHAKNFFNDKAGTIKINVVSVGQVAIGPPIGGNSKIFKRFFESLGNEDIRSVNVEIASENDQVSVRLINHNDVNVKCRGRLQVLIIDTLNYTKTLKLMNFDGYILSPRKSYHLITNRNNFHLQDEQEIGGIETGNSQIVCTGVNRSGVLDREGVEAALRNNHIELAYEIYSSSNFKNEIKYINLEGSHFSQDIGNLRDLNLNHIEPVFISDLQNSQSGMIKTKRCGLTYFEKRTDVCGVERFNVAASAACGVDNYRLFENPACGCRHRDRGFFQCMNGCDCVQFNACRRPEFGVESYKSCEHSSHGVALFKLCRDPSHGIENAKTCRL